MHRARLTERGELHGTFRVRVTYRSAPWAGGIGDDVGDEERTIPFTLRVR